MGGGRVYQGEDDYGLRRFSNRGSLYESPHERYPPPAPIDNRRSVSRDYPLLSHDNRLEHDESSETPRKRIAVAVRIPKS